MSVVTLIYFNGRYDQSCQSCFVPAVLLRTNRMLVHISVFIPLKAPVCTSQYLVYRPVLDDTRLVTASTKKNVYFFP